MKSRVCIFALIGVVFATSLGADEPKKKPETYQIPYRLTSTMHVLVRAKINGKGPFNFIVDTGAPILLVSTPVGKKLGLVSDKTATKEAKKPGWAVLDRFEIEGGAVLTNFKCRVETPFQLVGMNGMGLAGVELHGMIGYMALAHYKMEFDFSRDKMKWEKLNFNPPPPQGIQGAGGAMGGLEILGSVMKFLGFLAGRNVETPLVPRGYLGIELAEKDQKVTVQKVLDKTPAETSGLKAGDRIDQVQGKEVRSIADVQRLTVGILQGQAVRMMIGRGDEKKEITITAGEGL
jgi:hypothetical protein